METSKVRDYLKFAGEKSLEKLIGNEKILFTDKINKINRYGLTQERNILITDQAI